MLSSQWYFVQSRPSVLSSMFSYDLTGRVDESFTSLLDVWITSLYTTKPHRGQFWIFVYKTYEYFYYYFTNNTWKYFKCCVKNFLAIMRKFIAYKHFPCQATWMTLQIYIESIVKIKIYFFSSLYELELWMTSVLF